jgi:hypothetical protein
VLAASGGGHGHAGTLDEIGDAFLLAADETQCVVKVILNP